MRTSLLTFLPILCFVHCETVEKNIGAVADASSISNDGSGRQDALDAGSKPDGVAARVSPCASYGDLNDDGYVTEQDLTIMKELSIGTQPNEMQKTRVDLNGNGTVADAGDLVLLQRFVIGEINTFPVCRKPPCASYGDLNDDGYVTEEDLAIMKELSVGVPPSAMQKIRADLNGNGTAADVGDLVLMKRFVIGEISTFSALCP